MVWPPPKVLKSPEGEVTVERPHGGAPEASSVITGVAPEASLQEPSWQQGSGDAGPAPARPSPPALPGATVSVMAASAAVPSDWLDNPDGLIGCVLGNRYRVVGVIGRGPMGIACEGESSRGRQVTLKLLPRAPELPVEHFGWQLRQALALAHFDHPHVTAISDFGAFEDGSAFVSRSRVPGVSLRTMLRQGALPLARSLDIARQIAGALAAAHAQDIAHGRLKPENIIVQGGPSGGDVIKVVDFGMAGLPVSLRAVTSNEDEARLLSLRTRLYLPADVNGASPAIDVYSLGVVLFEMIAGQPPFAFETAPAPGSKPVPLSFAQCNPALVVPASVNELVLALLQPDAIEQGLTAARVAEMIDGLLGRPAAAREPVTAQVASAPASDSSAEPATATVPLPDVQAFVAPSAASMVWPSSPPPAPARPHSFPPLPQGFVSTFPPGAVELSPASADSEPPPPVSEAATGTRPSARSMPPTPPSRRSSAARPPPPPSSRRSPSSIDEPFATPSFPPPNVIAAPAPPAPDISVAQGAGSSGLPPSPSGTEDLDEMTLRPSLIGRLKRLFGKKDPTEF